VIDNIKDFIEEKHYNYTFNEWLKKQIFARDKEIERLHSIIKEVREYIEENQEEHKYTDRGGFTYTEGHFLRDSDTLLEILDKEKE
jgi:hypothetical protein